MNEKELNAITTRPIAAATALSVTLLWMAQPPWMAWPLALIALVPWLTLITSPQPITRRGYAVIWAVSTIYWLLSLQGLRHAHWAMVFPWLALGAYLAVYHVLFVVVTRRMLLLRIPLIVSAPLAWVAQECIRNYLLTGISALMLGHTLADVPSMIQIADIFGTYGVSFVIAMVNVAAFSLLALRRPDRTPVKAAVEWITTAIVLGTVLAYGHHRLKQPLEHDTATFALVQRNEKVDYGQSREHEIEMFQNYARQSVEAVRSASENVDAVVWPESMFSGGAPWMTADATAKVPAEALMSAQEFQSGVAEQRQYFLQRSGFVLDALATANASKRPPYLLVGCGVIHYGDTPHVYSGVISIRPDGSIKNWYGKTHLVMFGEYIPIAPAIPGLRSLVPPGMGLQTGPGAKRFEINGTSVSPSICIETAVERVIVKQLAELRSLDTMPDVLVTVTNDGWFDDSSVIDHHLRCAQLVAVGCRRPILSAANNGPTAWIDSRGVIVKRQAIGTHGAVIATPRRDPRSSIYILIGDWPARMSVLACGVALILARRKIKHQTSAAIQADDT